MVNFGIESGSPEILKLIGKKISLERAVEAVSACKKAGLRTQCTFIVGFPIDTVKTMAMTYSIAKKIDPTIAIFFPLTPYPGTKVYNEFLDKSLIPHSVKEWQNFIMTENKSGISLNKDFNGEDIKVIANRFNRKFFFRPLHILNMMKTVHSPTELFRLSRGALFLTSNYLKELVRGSV
jgi:radical SAM superfamily enzyme YgiQ (UPF0313 family)